jgi:hypothetical protein
MSEYFIYFFEALLAAAAFALGRFFPRAGRGVDRIFTGWCRWRGYAFLSIGVATVTLHICVLPLLPRRAPDVHDEFSYLLSARTFLEGRAANPPHPHWRSLESPHVTFTPYYASMYPPVQGLILAAGQFAGRDFLAGPILAGGFLAALSAWMLAGWGPLRWALLGGVLAGIRLGVFSYWTNSYWGGSGPAIGGMLVLGGLPRFLRDRRVRDAALVAIGFAILAASRPFETVLMVPTCIAASLAVRFRSAASLKYGGVTAALILASAAGALLWYNQQTTGDPFQTGYQLAMKRYGLAVFPWQSTVPMELPASNSLRHFYAEQHAYFLRHQTIDGFLTTRVIASVRFWLFFIGPLLTVPCLGIALLFGSRRWRWLPVAGLIYLAGLALNPWFFPHYFAPATGLLLLALIQSIRVLRARGCGFAMRAVPVICALMVLVRLATPSGWLPSSRFQMSWFHTPPGNYARLAVKERLDGEPGQHLVIVRYAQQHKDTIEWVYNDPEIDHAKVVWAHDLNAAANEKLIDYFAGRRIWSVLVTDDKAAVEEVQRSAAQTIAAASLERTGGSRGTNDSRRR